MTTLFSLEPVFPQGFVYMPGFITDAEEMQLLNIISKIELNTFIFQGFEAKRRVASFGYDYSFDKKKLSEGEPIPHAFDWLIERASDVIGVKPSDVAELLVLEYPAGAVINWHRDAPPFDTIAGISLLSDCTFKLRPQDKSKQLRGSIISFPVERRSLYIMRNEARSEWQHSTAPVKQLRYSITLRTLRLR